MPFSYVFSFDAKGREPRLRVKAENVLAYLSSGSKLYTFCT